MYIDYDRELLVIYLPVKHLRHMLEAHNFIIFIDHKPITFAFQQKTENYSPRKFRHLDLKQNIVADTLSLSLSLSLFLVEALSETLD